MFKLIFFVVVCSAWAQTSELPRLSRIAEMSLPSANQNLQALYTGATKNLDAQFIQMSDQTVYVSTGDIPAEWLRDSSVQVRPYLFFAKNNPAVAALVKGVIIRQGKSMTMDPYANAFKKDYSVWEQKYELDSLANPILLAWTYWKYTGDASVFTADVKMGFEAAIATMLLEQDHATNSKYNYLELSRNPVASTGMVWSGFRPSDDACQYHYLIPSEMMLAQALLALSEIERTIYGDISEALLVEKLRAEVISGIQKYGIIHTEKYGDVYAYEVDGLGHYNLMDDGNLPSLLGSPFLGFTTMNDPVYQNTRRLILSEDNPFYYQGSIASGVGSPHTPKGMVWPLALLAQAFTANDGVEFNTTLSMIIKSDPGDHVLHESFNPNNPNKFTRKDFGWPNAMLVELTLTKFMGFSQLPVVGE
jgi:meiotically up-regulated gene 157 (Mug157) protein